MSIISKEFSNKVAKGLKDAGNNIAEFNIKSAIAGAQKASQNVTRNVKSGVDAISELNLKKVMNGVEDAVNKTKSNISKIDLVDHEKKLLELSKMYNALTTAGERESAAKIEEQIKAEARLVSEKVMRASK